MAIPFEQVEKLKEKANISWEEARYALEANGGDLLDALIWLERTGRIRAPASGFYSTRGGGTTDPDSARLPASPLPPPGFGDSREKHTLRDRLRELLAAGLDILRHSTVNQFEVWRGDALLTSVPVLILVLLLIVAFYITIPLIVVGPFFGCRYRFQGPDLGKNSINDVIEDVSDSVGGMVERMKDEFKDKHRKR